MLTVQLAYELRDTAIKVNSAAPGYTATDLNGFAGTDTPAQGAAEAIRLALLPADGPSGTSSSSTGLLPWEGPVAGLKAKVARATLALLF